MINILIADDSETETILLTHIFQKEKDMRVIGCAKNGKEAVDMAVNLKPDLITMDINMPILNGFEATRLIMMSNPIPIVVISSTVNDLNLNTTFLALEAGALSVLAKPVDALNPLFLPTCKRMITLIRSMAEIKVIKRRFTIGQASHKSPVLLSQEFQGMEYEIVAIGSSVGGPQALKIILSQLPADFSVPIVIVQHMTPGFIEGLCQWLDLYCPLTIKCASNQEVLRGGTVYFAPDKYHLKIQRTRTDLVALLQEGESVSGFYPSITVLLESIAKTCGKNAIGMLLTGMGSDGANGLFDVKSNKGHTLIQDSASCIVFGMGGVAQSLGAVDKIVELDQIADYLIKIINY